MFVFPLIFFYAYCAGWNINRACLKALWILWFKISSINWGDYNPFHIYVVLFKCFLNHIYIIMRYVEHISKTWTSMLYPTWCQNRAESIYLNFWKSREYNLDSWINSWSFSYPHLVKLRQVFEWNFVFCWQVWVMLLLSNLSESFAELSFSSFM